MSDYKLEAELRELTGKANTRRLRHAGKLPGIIYGGDKPDLPITLDYNETAKIMMRDEHFYTSMIEISVKGKRGKESVILKDTQWDAIYDTPRPLDFYRVVGSDVITVHVPVALLHADTCPGVKEGGHIEMIRHELEVECRADAIPDHIEIDCSALQIDTTVHIDDVKLPKGVSVPHDVNFTIFNIASPKGAVVEEAAAEVVTEAAHGAEKKAD